MQLVKIFIIILAITIIPEYLFAQDDTALYEELCGIRKMFCGVVGLVIGVGAIFSLGILSFAGKIKWTTVLVISTGLVIFLGAENLASKIFTPPSGSDVVEQCRCV